MSNSFLFAYGSLKRNLHNHHYLSGAQYIGGFHTDSPFVLVARPSYPYLLKPSQLQNVPALQVSGECYLVNSKVLAQTDDIEANDVFYQREEISIRSHATGELQQAWAYFLIDSQYALTQGNEKPSEGEVVIETNRYIWRAS